jgi:hypothetical protein
MFEHIIRFRFVQHRNAVVSGDLLAALVTQRQFENYRRRDPLPGKILRIIH